MCLETGEMTKSLEYGKDDFCTQTDTSPNIYISSSSSCGNNDDHHDDYDNHDNMIIMMITV